MPPLFQPPPWWDEDCEAILRFVRQYRERRSIQPGTPVPMLWHESECGFFIFGELAHAPDYERGWNDLANPDIRKWALRRVEFETQKKVAA